MKVINNDISRDMVNKGLSDIKIKFGDGEEISGVKSVLMNGNEIFRRLIEDERCYGVLEMYEGCTKESFLLLEMYYGGGCIDINNENVIEILKICLYYNEDRLIPLCEKYIINHPDDIVMLELFELLHLYNSRHLRSLCELSEKYLETNGLKYLSEKELLLKMKIEDIEFILESPKLIIKDETFILNQLLKWYKYMNRKEKVDNDVLKENFMNLIKNSINLDKVKWKLIKSDLLNDLEKLSEKTVTVSVQQNSDEKSLDLSELNNERVEEIINKYYIEEEKTMIGEEDMNIIKENNPNEIISTLLKNGNVRIIEIGLLLAIDVEYEDKSLLIGKLSVEYLKNRSERVIKCLCLFTDDIDFISTIKTLCGKILLYRILNMKEYLKKPNIELIIKYLRNLNLNENDENEINKIINDEEILDMIKKLTSFSYPKSDFLYPPDEEFSIDAIYDGSKCKFKIEPKLPDGVYLDEETGRIYGKMNEVCSNKYVVSCENKWNKLEYKLNIEWKFCFDETNKSDNVILDSYKTNLKLSYLDFDYGYCFCNFKMESGVYTINFYDSYNEYINLCFAKDRIFHTNDILKIEYWDYRKYWNIGGLGDTVENYLNSSKFIIDMNKKEIYAERIYYDINHNEVYRRSNLLIVKNLPSPLYPFVKINSLEGEFHIEVKHEC